MTEKESMIKNFKCYMNRKGEVLAVINTRTMAQVEGAAAANILRYMRAVHGCSLIPTYE